MHFMSHLNSGWGDHCHGLPHKLYRIVWNLPRFLIWQFGSPGKNTKFNPASIKPNDLELLATQLKCDYALYQYSRKIPVSLQRRKFMSLMRARGAFLGKQNVALLFQSSLTSMPSKVQHIHNRGEGEMGRCTAENSPAKAARLSSQNQMGSY